MKQTEKTIDLHFITEFRKRSDALCLLIDKLKSFEPIAISEEKSAIILQIANACEELETLVNAND